MVHWGLRELVRLCVRAAEGTLLYDGGDWIASVLCLGSMLRAMSDTASGAEKDVSCTE